MTQRDQISLPLPPPPADSETPLVPARMVNEWVYCPRLAYLEWVEGEWADSADTVQGKRAHTRVDKGGGRLPSPGELDEEIAQARSVTMSSDRLGVIAKMDVLDIRDGVIMPVDFKKGKRPHVAAGAYEPERVQVCARLRTVPSVPGVPSRTSACPTRPTCSTGGILRGRSIRPMIPHCRSTFRRRAHVCVRRASA